MMYPVGESGIDGIVLSQHFAREAQSLFVDLVREGGNKRHEGMVRG